MNFSGNFDTATLAPAIDTARIIMDLLYRHRKLKGVCLRNVSLADNSLYKLRREKEQTSNDMEARKAESCAKIEVFESG